MIVLKKNKFIIKKMPQLDKFTFISVELWVFVAFITLYIVMTYVILPQIAQIIKVREKLNIKNNEKINKNKENKIDLPNLDIKELRYLIFIFENQIVNYKKLITSKNIIKGKNEF